MLTLSTLSGCGGGGGTSASLPGTGGTGVYAQGSITGFGSVIVNSIKFDDTGASVSLDGQAGSSAALRLGMVAEVQGQRSSSPGLGSASSISVWSVAQGRVTLVQSGLFTVMGMLIQTDSGTVFEGLANATALGAGMTVTVWGLQSGADGQRWTATRVALAASGSDSVCTGLVSVSGTSVSLNNYLLSGAAATGLAAGQLVRAQGVLSASNSSLQLGTVRAASASSGPVPQGEAEIEGVVTAVLSKTRFVLGTVEVDASSAAVSASVALLALGTRIEVYGTWQGRVLQASRISLENETSLQEVEIEAPIEQYTSLADFVVRGQRCNASGVSNLGSSTLTRLKVGVKVKLEGVKRGDVVMVSSLSLSG
jgi:hypothetical protein